MEYAVYIGAGLDIIPILILTNITTFIYIDSKPFSLYGTKVKTKDKQIKNISLGEINQYKDNLYNDKKFISNFDQLMEQNNFNLVRETRTYILYENDKNQKIKYYMNVAFPEFLTLEINADITKCNTIITGGFDPDKVILQYMKKPCYVIGNTQTNYLRDKPDSSLFRYLRENPESAKFYLLKKNTDFDEEVIENITPLCIENYQIIQCQKLGNFDELSHIKSEV
jgi:hypothetical protein